MEKIVIYCTDCKEHTLHVLDDIKAIDKDGYQTLEIWECEECGYPYYLLR